MIDPAECRRLAQECADIAAEFLRGRRPVDWTQNRLPAIASALTDAAELAERSVDVNEAQLLRGEKAAALARCRGLEAERDDAKEAAAQLRGERDAARAEVERLRAGIREVLDAGPSVFGHATTIAEVRGRLSDLIEVSK